MNFFKKIVAGMILTSASFTASAQASPAAKISTLENDKDRIHQGVKSGELTKKEAVRLRTQTARVRHEQKEYREDGVITPAERKDLRKDKKRLSKNIYKQKHDKQDRP